MVAEIRTLVERTMPAATAIRLSDYSLVGKDTALAVERGLAEADLVRLPCAER